MKFVYERRGSGSPLILLHGIGHRWQAWEPVLDRLAEHHDVIALDLPGFGEAPPFPADKPYDIETSLELLGQLVDDLELDRPHVAGNSLGGTLALEMAARDMVSSTTALSPAGFWNEPERTWALTVLRSLRSAGRLPTPLRNQIADHKPLRGLGAAVLYAHPTWQSPEATRGDLNALGQASGFGKVLRTGQTYRFEHRELPVPATIAWGTRDRILLPRQARRAAQQLPDAWHTSLRGCGHVPMTDAPTLVANTVLRTCELATKSVN